MKKISLLTIIIYIFSLGFVMAAEGHSHELPEFLHFMEELIEEHSILRGATFGFIHTLIPLIGFYTGWSINRFLKIISNGAIAGKQKITMQLTWCLEMVTSLTYR